ncbi:HAD-IC family P-type ATPase, partial [bacterium]|nr:HAD-IC family P-type ATPase [bacterium]
DYSFVTGESDPVVKHKGDIIYAGGRQVGSRIELEVIHEVSQSQLTRLWENKVFKAKDTSHLSELANQISKYFTAVVLVIAAGASVYWGIHDPSMVALTVTAVLIVACPCALALASPFTLGTALRIFGRNNLFLKSTSVIESLTRVKHIVFDKTGTLTHSRGSSVDYQGDPITVHERSLVYSLAVQSTHPLSIHIADNYPSTELYSPDRYDEVEGLGIVGEFSGIEVRLGSWEWVIGLSDLTGSTQVDVPDRSVVYLSINKDIKGFYSVLSLYREGVSVVVDQLGQNYNLTVLSGDSEREKETLERFFPHDTLMFFRQTPEDKLHFIEGLQEQGEGVLMLGDGLNDAGALKAGEVGIAVTENTSTFSPASDGLLLGKDFGKLATFLQFAKSSRSIIWASFVLSFIYNIIGISFAVMGKLSPLVSAILMPLSSITVVLFATAMTKNAAKKLGLGK